MAIKAARRFSEKMDTLVFKRVSRGNQENISRNHQVRDVFQRLGNVNQENIVGNHKIKTVVCKYWLEGRCTRNPCKFMHPNQEPVSFRSKFAWKNPSIHKSENTPHIEKTHRKVVKTKEICDHNQIVTKTVLNSEVNVGQTSKKTENHMEGDKNHMEGDKCGVIVGQGNSIKVTDNCMKHKTSGLIVGQSKNMETENCTKGENCENLQSWFGDYRLSVVAHLGGHTKAVTGIVYPYGSNKLFCGSKDKSMRVWGNSGQCGHIENFDGECRTVVKEGPWIFAGLRDMIKAWNFETQTEVVIRASGGHVNAITMYEDILFAGMEDGTILSWKSASKTSFSEDSTSLKGHSGSVLSLIIGAKKLFSGSADHTIRVWDCDSLECTHVLNGHTSDVTAVLCWDQYLLSGSLDKTIKVWGASESGNIEEVYIHNVNDGVLAFCGMHDAEEKPILLCSCKDNGVHLYDLPSFVERGRIFSGCDIQSIVIGPEGLFFTGDASGLVTVWKPSEPVRKLC